MKKPVPTNHTCNHDLIMFCPCCQEESAHDLYINFHGTLIPLEDFIGHDQYTEFMQWWKTAGAE